MASIYNTFVDGDAFTAADANNYFMRQVNIVCDNQTDRDAILTPNEGMTVYRKDLDAKQTYDGAAWHTHSTKYAMSCKAIRSSTVSIPHAAETTVSWNSEDYDAYNMHDNSTNPERIVVPEAGDYIISGFAKFAVSVVACAIRFNKNGSSLGFYYVPGSITAAGDIGASRVERLAASDYITMQVFQSNGSSAARDLDQAAAYLQVNKI